MKLSKALILLSIFFIGKSYAFFPEKCKTIKIAHSSKITLDFADPMVLYVYKKPQKSSLSSDAKFWLIDTDKSSDDPLSIELLADTWSAMFVPPSKIELICIESKPGHEQQLMCDEEITACIHKPTQKWDGITDKNKSQWIVRNQLNTQ